MSKVCQVTGAKPGFGNNVSHSHRPASQTCGIGPR